MHRLIRLTCAVLLFSPTVASADAYCGPSIITRSLVYQEESLRIYAPWRSDFITVCRFDGSWKNISTSTCWAWFAKIETSVSQGKKVGFYYGGLQQSECATMSTYDNAPAPLYVDLTP